MAKKKKDKIVIKEEIIVEKKEKLIDLDRAVKYFKKEYPQKGLYLDDKEALGLFVKKYIPSLLATKEKYFDILRKY